MPYKLKKLFKRKNYFIILIYMISETNDLSEENTLKISTDDYMFTHSYAFGNENLDASLTEKNNLNFQNSSNIQSYQIKSFNTEVLNNNNQIIVDIVTFSQDNKYKSFNEKNNIEELIRENILENDESYNDELDIENNLIQESIPQDNVENIFKYNLNVNKEDFQKYSIIEKEDKSQNIESEKPQKIRSNHDYLIKSFLSNSINTYSFGKLYNLVKKLGGRIYKCDYNKIINANERHLSNLLEKTIEEIFTIYDEKAKKEGIRQKNNKKVFENFYESISDKKDLSEDEEELFNLLRSTYEDQLKLYYKSKEIEKFKNKNLKHGTPVDYDKKFYNERNRGYYLLEPYGFIRYAKSKPYCHNERKKK